jgi:hypothetical protein
MGSNPIVFRCDSSSLSLGVDVPSHESPISSSFRLPPTLPVIQPRDVSVSVFALIVRFANHSFLIEADPYSSVSDLRASVASGLALPPEQFHLVSAGQILQDFFTLSYHNLIHRATVYVVPLKERPKAQPSALLESLRQLAKAYTGCHRPREIAHEISELINNPILQSLSRIDAKAKQAIDEAYLLVDLTQSRATRTREAAIAALNDTHLAQLDGSREGRSLFQQELSRKQDPEFTRIDSPVNLNYIPAIAERAVPVWWIAEKINVRKTFRENFSEQVRILKRMGFDDEAVILLALRETSGNVPRAAKYLIRTGHHRI